MIFTSFEFAIFFALVIVARWLIPSFTLEKVMLLIASYLFYMSWNPPWVLLLVGTSLLDYLVGLALERTQIGSRRTILLTVSLFANLGVLCYFKYFNFFVDNVSAAFSTLGIHIPISHLEVFLPVGISFFTFQSMSYTIDVYRREIPACRSIRDFLLFVAFFPQLVAGPIVRAADFLPQLRSRVRAKLVEIESGLAQFGLGAIKKIVVSDQVSPHVDLIFGNPGHFDALTLFVGLLGYAVQIYCDFSGYSDMAIGCARMMGYHFPENFRIPYSAVSITEFWRRWHISLSTWLRDYLYIPLGGNRKGQVRTYVNLFLTMFLGGLWHGASWNFVAWGTLHGVALAGHKAWGSTRLASVVRQSAWLRIPWAGFSHALTLFVVLLGWVFFRAQTWSSAVTYLERMLTLDFSGTRMLSPYILAGVAAVTVTHLLVKKDSDWSVEVVNKPTWFRIPAYAGVIFVLVCFGATDATPFIYFQF